MQLRVPIIVKDLSITHWKGLRPEDALEHVVIKGEDFFLDGPVSARVAVLDFDPKSGACIPVKLTRAAKKRDGLAYAYGALPTAGGELTPTFLGVSVFGTVHKVISLFEEPDTLGRRLEWAFEGPQLLVVPRAGEMANAFYERYSRSLQFFYVERPNQARIYTAASQDIVAHETGHAVLDAIAPDLYDAVTPQSLAMHEAIADLVSLHCALRYRPLSDKVLSDMNGDLGRSSSTAFSILGEEFGEALRQKYVRDLSVRRGLPGCRRGYVPVETTKPHDLSVVLSGALYCVLLQHYETAKKQLSTAPARAHLKLLERMKGGRKEQAVWRTALFLATERFKRFVFRALDYLPPGDATWLDLAHAMIACDAAHHPEADELRDALVEELVARNVGTREEILPARVLAEDAIDSVDLRTLLESDWAAYEWVRRHREELGIPDRIPFHVMRRLEVNKLVYHRDGRETTRELVLKVKWEETEPNPRELRIARARSVTRGTTLAVHWPEGGGRNNRILAQITSHATRRDREARDELLLRLAADGRLRRADGAAENQLALGSALYAEVTDDVMTLKGGARLLHIVGDDT